MTRTLGLSLFGILAIVLFSGFAPFPATTDPENEFLKRLHPDQPITIKDTSGGFEISVFDNLPASHKVISVGNDHIAIVDANNVTETVIPVYQIRCIRRFKLR